VIFSLIISPEKTAVVDGFSAGLAGRRELLPQGPAWSVIQLPVSSFQEASKPTLELPKNIPATAIAP
jgi:hypothetical protein